MKVVNVHQRLLHARPDQVGALIASLATPDDKLWPRKGWPRMKFDRPLAVGEAAQIALGNQPKPMPWPLHVKLLHWLMTPRKRPAASSEGEPHAS